MQTSDPNLSNIDPYSHHHLLYDTARYYSHLHSQSPNPTQHKPHEPTQCDVVGLYASLRPPEIDQFTSVSSYTLGPGGGYQAHLPGGVAYVQPQTVVHTASAVVPSAYCPDQNAVSLIQNLAVKEAVPPYGLIPYATGLTMPPNGTEQVVPANSNATMWTNPTIQSRGNGAWKRGPKKIKVVQSAWCEICKVGCNSKDVLYQHKMGKKHKKNIEKLTEATVPAPSAPTESDKPVIGPQENPDKSKSVGGQKTKKRAESAEDLETKKRKILEGGAAADAVRSCAICNVVCNSETVFKYHLVGQKHAAMVKKHASGTEVA